MSQEKKVEETGLNDIVYKVAADIVKRAFDQITTKTVEGAKVIELCTTTDKFIEEEASKVFNNKKPIPPKGVSFPTCVSVNNIISHFSPLASDPETSSLELKNGDVVKIQLGAHIDGYASIAAETIVVGASAENPVTGRKADAVQAAWYAAEASIRQMKIGEKNWTVSETVNKATKPFETAAVEGMLSCQMTQNVIDGKKRIILNGNPQQKSDLGTHTFEEGEVYGIDVLVSTNKDNKPKDSSYQTTVYKRTDQTYILKLATARRVYSEIQKKSGSFPFNLRTLEDEKRARLGVQESVQHSLLTPFDVSVDKSDETVAQFFFTVGITKNGPIRLTHPPSWLKPEFIKSDKQPDEETKQLSQAALRPKKNNKKKAAPAA
ncbi:Creatinase/aminopeptidase [Wallemia mellicola]|nr:Creatinase/aminopeptidase [Wallemia mellicola]